MDILTITAGLSSLTHQEGAIHGDDHCQQDRHRYVEGIGDPLKQGLMPLWEKRNATRPRVLPGHSSAPKAPSICSRQLPMSASKPMAYTFKVSIPLPRDDEIRGVVGPAYRPGETGNFAKMFAGTGDLHAAMLGLDKAVFQAEGVDPKARQIILRSAKVMDAPYEWRYGSCQTHLLGLASARSGWSGHGGQRTLLR